MKAAEALIAWTPNTSWHYQNPTRGQLKVGSLIAEGQPDWTQPYASSGGAAFVNVRSLEGWQAIAMVFIAFNTLTLRDGLKPQTVHDAFLAIDEYRWTISPDIPGAEEPDGATISPA